VDFGLPCLDCALLTVHLGSGAQLVIFLAVKSVSLPVFFSVESPFSLADRVRFPALDQVSRLESLLVVLCVSCSSPISVPMRSCHTRFLC
jgi:hypothetical protein